MTILSLCQLQKARTGFLSNIKESCYESFPLWITLASKGLRFIEAYETRRWKNISTNKWSLYTAKMSEERIFDKEEINERFLSKLNSDEQYTSIYSYRTLLRQFDIYFPYSGARIGQRAIKTHIFRHIRALELYEGGMSKEMIQKYLGHYNGESTNFYLNKDIYIA
ncbi:MAG: tyrosine-type recombinase/integrase [Dysgonamonadaceae bacterium]|jgi:hypothetical protein|nr:tyrosine-type recombinase/integrase [Dysgonamonadaceae bacterium]